MRSLGPDASANEKDVEMIRLKIVEKTLSSVGFDTFRVGFFFKKKLQNSFFFQRDNRSTIVDTRLHNQSVSTKSSMQAEHMYET